MMGMKDTKKRWSGCSTGLEGMDKLKNLEKNINLDFMCNEFISNNFYGSNLFCYFWFQEYTNQITIVSFKRENQNKKLTKDKHLMNCKS